MVGPRREGLRVPAAGAPGQDGVRLVDQGVVDIAAKNDRPPPLGGRPGVARGRRRGPGVVKGYRRRKMLREEARVLPARSRPWRQRGICDFGGAAAESSPGETSGARTMFQKW